MLRIVLTLAVAMLGSTTHAIELNATSMTEFGWDYLYDLEDDNEITTCLNLNCERSDYDCYEEFCGNGNTVNNGVF